MAKSLSAWVLETSGGLLALSWNAKVGRCLVANIDIPARTVIPDDVFFHIHEQGGQGRSLQDARQAMTKRLNSNPSDAMKVSLLLGISDAKDGADLFEKVRFMLRSNSLDFGHADHVDMVHLVEDRIIGLFLYLSLIEHSCAPCCDNIVVRKGDGRVQSFLVVLKDVSKGTRVTASYLGLVELALPTASRRKILRGEPWYFECLCSRCSTSDDGALHAGTCCHCKSELKTEVICRTCCMSNVPSSPLQNALGDWQRLIKVNIVPPVSELGSPQWSRYLKLLQSLEQLATRLYGCENVVAQNILQRRVIFSLGKELAAHHAEYCERLYGADFSTSRWATLLAEWPHNFVEHCTQCLNVPCDPRKEIAELLRKAMCSNSVLNNIIEHQQCAEPNGVKDEAPTSQRSRPVSRFKMNRMNDRG